MGCRFRVTGHSCWLLKEHLTLAQKNFSTVEALAEYLNKQGVSKEELFLGAKQLSADLFFLRTGKRFNMAKTKITTRLNFIVRINDNKLYETCRKASEAFRENSRSSLMTSWEIGTIGPFLKHNLFAVREVIT